MDFRMYDNALGRFYGMDALSEKNHYLSPFQFGNGNPVFWADPTGLDVQSGKDTLGRDKFDRWGNYIPGFERLDVQYNAFEAGESVILGGGFVGVVGVDGKVRVNVVVSLYEKDDSKLENIEASLKKLDPTVLIIRAGSIEELNSQLEEKVGNNMINNLIFIGHGDEAFISFGKDLIMPGKAYDKSNTKFQEVLGKYLDSNSSVTFTACHAGRSNGIQGIFQNISDKTGATFYLNRTWGRGSVNRFNNDEKYYFSNPNYPNYYSLPPGKNCAGSYKSACENLGNWTKISKGNEKSVVTYLFFSRAGNINFN